MFPPTDPCPDAIGETGASDPKAPVSLTTDMIMTAAIPVASTLHQAAVRPPPRGLRISGSPRSCWGTKRQSQGLALDLGLVAAKLGLSLPSPLPTPLSSARTTGVPFCPRDRDPGRQGGLSGIPSLWLRAWPKAGIPRKFVDLTHRL